MTLEYVTTATYRELENLVRPFSQIFAVYMTWNIRGQQHYRHGEELPEEVRQRMTTSLNRIEEKRKAFRMPTRFRNDHYFEELFEKGGLMVFAKDPTRDHDNSIVGMCAMSELSGELSHEITDDETYGEITSLYVSPEYRGRRVATTLLELLINEARTRSYHSLLLDTVPHMTEAHELYRKLGFVVRDRYPGSGIPPEAVECIGSIFMELVL